MPDHLLELEQLPLHHRDPFDRMLIAAAISEGMNFITADKNVSLYPIRCVW
jgi:PIN domain nuclease of toxin-antitoxin system